MSKSAIDREDLIALVLFALTGLMIFGSRWISSALGTWSQAEAIVVISVFVVIVSFGQQTVMLTGGLDLSIPSVMTLAAVLLFSEIGGNSGDLLWGMPLVLGVAGLIGAVSGLCIALLGVPPLIMTLGMDLILRSVLLGMTGGAPVGSVSPVLVSVFTADWFGLPPVLFLLAGFVVLASLVQRRSVFGRYLYAVGANRAAAHVSGLPVTWIIVACYVISAMTAGLAGILMVGFSEGATLSSGENILIPAIAAVVIGGTSILGGRGSYPCAVGGALLLTTFATMITALGVDEAWRTIIYGLVILGALLLLQQDLGSWVQRMRVSLRPVRVQSPTNP